MLDSYIFAFWTKTSVDAEPRRIRLKSNSYTTNNILDTVIGTVQKFSFKLLSEGFGQTDMDVLCQVCGVSLVDIVFVKIAHYCKGTKFYKFP